MPVNSERRFRSVFALALVLVLTGFGASVVSAVPAGVIGANVPVPVASATERLKAVYRALVPLRAKVPHDARTIRYLGAERRGTGIVIDGNGLILTIGSLILEANEVEVGVKGNVVPAEVVAYDYRTGFGLVRAKTPLDASPLRFGQSTGLGERTPVMVASFGGESGLQPALIVSRRDFAGYWEYVLEDAIFTSPPHPNFSGAALLSLEGKLLGVGYLIVNDAIENGPVPGNLFIPIDRLKPILGELLFNGRSEGDQPWLGLFAQEVRSSIVVTSVVEEGPAEHAGIQTGDVVMGVGDTPVASLIDLFRLVWSYGEPGVDVPLVVYRKDGMVRITVKSGNRYEWFKQP